MTTYKIDLDQFRLTYQILNLDHEIMIISYKTNKKIMKLNSQSIKC